MEKVEISQNIYKFSIDGYKEINKKILSYIDDINTSIDFTSDHRITKHDFNKNLQKDYWIYFSKYLHIYLQKFVDDFSQKMPGPAPSVIVNNFWFQQYEEKDNHPFHIHPTSSYSMIYFVEIYDQSVSTIFLNAKREEIKLKVNPGDLILFPSYVYHSSPVNNSGKRKTILSANLLFK